MRRSRGCEDPDVQAIMDAGTESVEWVAQEFARADLCDKRLDRRLLKTAEQLAKSPSSPINEACGSWASTQAAYRLFNNPEGEPGGDSQAAPGSDGAAHSRVWWAGAGDAGYGVLLVRRRIQRRADWDRSARVTRRTIGA